MRSDHNSVLLALSTYPSTDEIQYLNLVTNNFKELRKKRYDNFTDEPKKINKYYNPKVYHIFGKYDVAFFTIIDNIQISSKVFYPFELDVDEKIEFVKSQVITGILPSEYNCTESLYDSLYSDDSPPFFSVTNLKLNNGWLLGEGYKFVKECLDEITKIVGSRVRNHLILDSFGTFELTLLMWDNDPQNLNEIIREIREVHIGEKHTQFPNALYNKRDLREDQKSSLEHCNLITETQSYIGIELLVSEDEVSFANVEGVNLKTQIEWHVKPGHFNDLIYLLQKEPTLKDTFDFEGIGNIHFLMGKTDYIFKEKSTDFSNNLNIFNLLRKKESQVKNHIRSIKTKINFNVDYPFKNGADIESILNEKGVSLNNEEFLKKNAYSIKRINELKNDLKSLKISKILRYKVIKVFYNYNNAIQNQVIYNLFVDFIPFIKELEIIIIDNAKKISSFYNIEEEYYNNKSVNEIEEHFTYLCQVFEDAFYLRYVNNYILDEVNDFFITYNSPIQQLITGLDNFFKIILSQFLGDSAARVLTRVNHIQTVASKYSVNFSLYNFYEPGALLALITKETFTSALTDLDDDQLILMTGYKASYKAYWKLFFKENSYLKVNNLKSILLSFDIKYFFNDYYRLATLCDFNFELFVYWFISVNSQLPSFYSTTGNVDKEYFIHGLIRLLFIAHLMDQENGNNKYSEHLRQAYHTPSTKQYWSKYGSVLDRPISDFVKSFNVLGEKYSVTKTGTRVREVKEPFISRVKDFQLLSRMQMKDASANVINIELQDLLNEKFEKEESFFELVSSETLTVFSINLLYWYLNKVYCTNKVPILLQRDWVTGFADAKNKSYSSYPASEDLFFLLDPSGGVWFHSFNNMQKYAILRNKFYVTMLHLSYLYKGHLLIQNTSPNE